NTTTASRKLTIWSRNIAVSIRRQTTGLRTAFVDGRPAHGFADRHPSVYTLDSPHRPRSRMKRAKTVQILAKRGQQTEIAKPAFRRVHAVISLASGRPAAKSEMLTRVVSRIVPTASRVKNA